MHLRNFFSRRIGTILVLSTLPGQGQESETLKDPLWSPQGKMELLDPPGPLDQPWARLTPPLEKPAMRAAAFPDQALLVTPHDALLMGQEPEVAYRKVQRLMAQRSMADHVAGVEGLGRAGAEALLHDARKLLHAIQEEHPRWKPDLIAREIAETDRRLERLRREARERFKAASPDRNRRDGSQTKILEPTPSPQRAEAAPEPLTIPESPQADRNREVNDLRRQLHQTEQALHESRLREEALRTVVRDLINQIEASKPSPSGPPPPRPVPFRPFPPPPSPPGPPLPPPVR